MLKQMLEVLCGGLCGDEDFSKSACFFLGCGMFIKVISVLGLGFTDAVKPRVKVAPSLAVVKYCGFVECCASAIPFFFALHSPAYTSLIDSFMSILLFWIMFDSFKACSLSRWNFVFVIVSLFSYLWMLVWITYLEASDYSTLPNNEKYTLLTFIVREIALLLVLFAFILTMVYDPNSQLSSDFGYGTGRESSMLRISLLGMNKRYTLVSENDAGVECNNNEYDFDLTAHKNRNYYSLLFFAWMTATFERAKGRILNVRDVPALPHERSCSHNSDNFFNELIRQNMNILRAIKNIYLREYVQSGVLLLVKSLASFLGPLMLDELVRAAADLAQADPDQSHNREKQWSTVYLYISVLFISKLICAFAMSHYNFCCQCISIGLSAAIKGSLYRKTLLLSSQSRQAYTMGSITNLYTVDTDRVVNVTIALHNFWALPLQILIAMVLLYFVVSWAVFAGFGAIVIVLLLNKVISKKIKIITDGLMTAKDTRMKDISEIFKSLLTIKLNSWESKFQNKVLECRAEELKLLWILLVLLAINVFLLWMAPNVVSVATIVVYAKGLGEDITTARIFTALALFRLLKGLLRALPDYISQYFQALVSLNRLETFLNMPEKDGMRERLMDCDGDLNNWLGSEKFSVGEIYIENYTFRWHDEICNDNRSGMKEPFHLHNMDTCKQGAFKLQIQRLHILPAQFVVVKGVVGSGKSSLCHALLGEMPKYDNNVENCFHLRGKVAFAGQQAWIQSGKLRDNILFGLPYEKEKYNRVVDACCLSQDFAELPNGDLTFIGQRGINLSGGQKSRTALARAIYADADIYILDDVFAALDSIVGKKVFENVVLQLLQGKTRVVVTHKEFIIAHTAVNCVVDISPEGILMMDIPECREVETDEDLAASRSILSIMAMAHGDTFKAIDKEQISSDDDNDFGIFDIDYSYSGKMIERKQDLDVDEDNESGVIDASVFKGYLSAAGGLKVIALLLCIQSAWQVLSISADVFIARWANESDEEQRQHINSNIAIYSSLALGSGLLVLVRTLTISTVGFTAAKNMFESMLASLLYAPMWWHDRNPTGRILNRFSDDQDKVDVYVSLSLGSVFSTCFSTGGSLVTILVITRYLGLVVIPIAWVYFLLMQTYLTVGREVQRLQSLSKSPFLSLISESVDGLAQIRSFGISAVQRLVLRNDHMVDDNCRATYAIASANAWFTLRVQLLSAVFVLAICGILFAGAFSVGFISPSLLALALSYSLYISDDLMILVTIWSWFEQSMVCPERILQYIDVPPEGTSVQRRLFKEDDKDTYDMNKGGSVSPTFSGDSGVSLSSTSWPVGGVIEYRNVWFRYQPIESSFEKRRQAMLDDIDSGCVLRNISFKTGVHEKIGIVGRTGAGKSSLTMSLFRISEIARGEILIDGIDISTLSLPILRSAIEIVPQNPVVFKGTLRSYVDPFDEYDDSEIWSALRKAKLEKAVERMSTSSAAGLLAAIAENGENLSVGERQMLVMSRALLREAKILVMDEATAAMDIESDQLLQLVLKEEFKDTTVLTIAHRIETIIDCDRVIVMSEGKMIEFDKPEVLIKRKDSAFRKLAQDAGINIGED